MSYSYERVDRRSRTTGGAGYGPTSRRSTLGYWVPLIMTVTVATMGLAAWIWSERRDDEDETGDEEHPPADLPPPGYASMSGGLPPGPGPAGFQASLPATSMGPDGFEIPTMPQPAAGHEGGARSTGLDAQLQSDGTLMSKMSGALKRTSYDWASKKVAAGVAAAGAMVGGALNTIREGNQDDYEDHERWSEEADSRNDGKVGKGVADGADGADGTDGKHANQIKRGLKRRGTADDYFSGAVEMPKPVAIKSRKRKNVAVVVSAVESGDRKGEVDQHAVSFTIGHDSQKTLLTEASQSWPICPNISIL
jgi:hypothetical protein